jgi:capsular exopolysaccharide synthesis family protein
MFWRWKLLFVAVLVSIPLAVYLIERGRPNVYRATTLIQLQDLPINIGTSSAPIVTGNIDAVARLVTTTPVAKLAAALLNPPASDPRSLLGSVSASSDEKTGFLTISAQSTEPRQAAAIANAFASALMSHQAAQASQTINKQIAADRRQLSRLPVSDQTERTTVSQEIARLEGLSGATSAGAQVIEPAVPSSSPVGPNTRRSVELAIVLALLLAVGAVLVAEHSDRRLRTPEDLESLTGWPLLGAVPATAFSSGEREANPREDEAFQMLEGALTYFNADRPLSSVAVISPLVGDGKTTVAVGLAAAAARAGKTTILVDADLRRSRVCTRLGINPTVGLGDVLTGRRSLEEALIWRPVDATSGGRLLVLGAGTNAVNPAALMKSPRMGALLRELEARADLVIIDTAAALAVSDSLPLLKSAAGTVMVVRLNRSARAAVRRIQKVAASAGATVLGVIATGSGRGTGYGYDYYDYGGENLNALRRWLLRLRRPSLKRGGEADHRADDLNGANSANGQGASSQSDRARQPEARV